MSKPTPTRHGKWRMIDGQLVDESTLTGTQGQIVDLAQVAEPLIASTDVREGGPGIPVPPADAPNPSPATRRSKPKSKE